MNKVSQRSARYFYFLMKVLFEDRDKLSVKMNQATHLYILNQAAPEMQVEDPKKVKHEIGGVNIIYDENLNGHQVLMDVREPGAFNSYQIDII